MNAILDQQRDWGRPAVSGPVVGNMWLQDVERQLSNHAAAIGMAFLGLEEIAETGHDDVRVVTYRAVPYQRFQALIGNEAKFRLMMALPGGQA